MPGFGSEFTFSVEGRAGGGDLLIVPLASRPRPPLQLLAPVDALCDDVASELIQVGALRDEPGTLAHGTTKGRFRRLLLVGVGPLEQLTGARVRTAGAATARWLADNGVAKATLWIDGLAAGNLPHAAAEFCAGLVQGGFAYNEFKQNGNGNGRRPPRIAVALRSGQAEVARKEQTWIERAAVIAAGVNTARRLGHAPANVLHPPALADEARRLARRHKLACTIFGLPELKKRRMNGLLSVGCGAAHKPCLVRLDYRGADRARRPTVVIGKAVTFDTGGYSLKDKAGLESLKFDKCGGAAVFGLLEVCARLKLRANVIGLIPAAENAISAEAYRPGDIIPMMNGKTVEIISTDAEGRMILADALCYAQSDCQPAQMIDLATLTGGVTIALGRQAAGLMANQDALAAELEECGRFTGERLWRFPLWDEYRELIKGRDSDLRNSSNKREAHAIVGGMFLKEFVDPTVPWAHLDIAAAAVDDPPAANGFGVRLLVEYLERGTR